MFDQIFGLLTGRNAATPTGDDPQLRICVAALLVEAARMDDKFDAEERAATLGAVATLTKPIDFDVLMAVVRRYCA